MPAVDRNVRHSAFTAPVKSDYLMLEAFQEAVHDVQRAARNVAAAYSQRVTVIAEESDIFPPRSWLSCERLSIRSVP